jgi:HTH-type transcriptional regulator, competence development regulator
MTAEELGLRLQQVRELRGRSLRDVAEDAGISASYLQKIERGQVKSPSPNVLYTLAGKLAVPYSELMRLAGYVVPREGGDRTTMRGNVLAHALSSEELTDEESAAVAEYLAWFRQRRASRRGAGST